jgi:hypothetical protein
MLIQNPDKDASSEAEPENT